MHRLIYVSRSSTPFQPDLQSILQSSQKNNARLGVTGALCFLDGVYCQYLEGDRNILADLYRLILTDLRHKELKLIDFGRIPKHLYATWTMALVTWNEQTRALFKTVNQINTPDLYAITTASAAATFDALANSSNWLELATPAQNLVTTPSRVISKVALQNF